MCDASVSRGLVSPVVTDRDHVIEVRGWLPPGLNGPGGLIRMHWATKKRRYQTLVALLARKRLPEIREPVSITYTRFSLRSMDWDNRAASAKIPLDVLRELGVLEDDNPECIVDGNVREEIVKTRAEQGFRIEFHPVD